MTPADEDAFWKQAAADVEAYAIGIYATMKRAPPANMAEQIARDVVEIRAEPEFYTPCGQGAGCVCRQLCILTFAIRRQARPMEDAARLFLRTVASFSRWYTERERNGLS